MKEVVIVGGTRTAIGDFGGSLKDIQPLDLAQHVIKDVLTRATTQPNQIDKTIFGCCFAPTEQNITRSAAFKAGIPEEVPGFTVNGTCGSSIQAIISGTQSILCGESDAILAGGVESMSRAPYALPKPEQLVGNLTAYDTSLGWRFTNPRLESTHGAEPMGVTAENIAEMTGITRQAQDEFALISHQRAVAAIDTGKFAEESLPVPIPQRKGDPILFTTDERPRRDTSLESLSRLKPAFKKDGTVTAGNSSGLNDGAAALLVMREDTAAKLGYTPMARFCRRCAAHYGHRSHTGYAKSPAASGINHQ